MTFIRERIFATRTRKPGEAKFGGLAEISLSDSLGIGSESIIYRAIVSLGRNGKRRSVELALKTILDSSVTNDEAINNYSRSKAGGLPVAPTFRSTENGIDLLSTELTRNGKYIVLSPWDLLHRHKTLEEFYRKRPEQMKSFGDGEPLNSTANRQKYIEYAQKGARAGLQLPSDVWFIIIKQFGIYDFILEDFGHFPNDQGLKEEERKAFNLRQLTYASDVLSTLQDYGKEPKSAQKRLEVMIREFNVDFG